MAQTFFIDAAYVKLNTVVDENIDQKYISIAIQDAQKNKLMYLIGSGLYNEIAGQLPGSLSANNATLLNNYIAPLLLKLTMVELLPHLNYKLSNRNVSTKESDSTSPVSWTQIDHLIKKYESDAHMAWTRMRDYLDQNDTLYPLWSNPGSQIDTIFPQHNTFDAGIFLGQNIDDCERIKILNGKYT